MSALEQQPEFTVGQYVTKPKGYPYPGWVVAVFTNRAGDLRLVVESQLAPGMLHIFAPTQVVPAGCTTTPGCTGDDRYAAPGRGHDAGCTHPIDTSLLTPFEAWCERHDVHPETPGAWEAYRSEHVPPL